jgi:hypothetical protein
MHLANSFGYCFLLCRPDLSFAVSLAPPKQCCETSVVIASVSLLHRLAIVVHSGMDFLAWADIAAIGGEGAVANKDQHDDRDGDHYGQNPCRQFSML